MNIYSQCISDILNLSPTNYIPGTTNQYPCHTPTLLHPSEGPYVSGICYLPTTIPGRWSTHLLLNLKIRLAPKNDAGIEIREMSDQEINALTPEEAAELVALFGGNIMIPLPERERTILLLAARTGSANLE